MTMPVDPALTQAVELPQPGYPMVTRVISNALFPENGQEAPVTWVVSHPHPLVPTMRVVRMFIDRGGVEIYSVSADGKNGMRNLIPMSWVRLVEEAMPIDIFADELYDAETGDPDPDPEPAQVPAANEPPAV